MKSPAELASRHAPPARGGYASGPGRRLIGAIAVLVALVPLGCAEHTQPIVPATPPTAGEQNFQAVWNASLAVLREYGFTVVAESRREGTIATAPLVGRHWFEVWRHDAATPEEVAESTLQTLYKSATVTVRPDPDWPDSYYATVAVEVWRSNKPEMIVTSTSEAYGLFTTNGARARGRWLTDFGRTTEEEELTAEEEARTAAGALRATDGPVATTRRGPPSASTRVFLGRDGPLEKKMTSDIAAALGRRVAAR